MSDQWLTSLITPNPQAGFELAITLSRRGVKYTQPDMATLKELRPEYAHSADALTAAFTEFSNKVEKNKEKPSVIQMLRALKLPQLNKDVTKVRNKDKGLQI